MKNTPPKKIYENSIETKLCFYFESMLKLHEYKAQQKVLLIDFENQLCVLDVIANPTDQFRRVVA